jgi:hypothetical protein
MKIGELFVQLGIKVDQERIARFQRGIKDLRTNIIAVQAAFVGAAFAIDRFVDGTVKGQVALQNLNNQTGLAIEDLERLQQAGQLADLTLTPEAIAQSVGNLQKQLAAIKIGQGNIAPFQILGIDPAGKNAFQVVEQLRESIKGLDPALATNLIGQLGLSPQFINILKLTNSELKKLSDNVFLSRQQRADIIGLGTAITGLKLRFVALKDQAVAKLAPILTKLVEDFFQWLVDNQNQVINTIAGFVKQLTNFVAILSRAFGVVADFINKITGLDSGIKALAAGFGLLLLSFRPFLLALGLFVALLEDIAVFQRGGKSLFGPLFEAINSVPNLAEALGGAALLLFLTTLGKRVGLISKNFGVLAIALGAIKKIGLGRVLGGLALAGAAGLQAKNQEGKGEKSFLDIFSSVATGAGIGATIAGPVGAIGGAGIAAILAAREDPQQAAATNNLNITQNIQGGSDPQTTADAVVQNIKQASITFNNGGF